VFKTVFATFLQSVDAMRRFILLAYQETKSLNTETRRALIAREQHLQALLGEAIRYGAEQGRFSSDAIELKAHNIMMLAHAWAIRHWAFVGKVASIGEYIEFLQPLVLAMLETTSGSEKGNKGKRQPVTTRRRVPERQGDIAGK
jgi:TetR/AcrR family transcriptional regulator, cholesterol catabolism regulator